MDSEFFKIRRLPPYVFAEVNAMKARARACGDDIIDFGMGNPDFPTPPHIVAKLTETVQDPRTHRYSESRGIKGLRRALAAYYERRFNVAIDPETEAVVTLGSKEGLANLASAISSPGDVILVPNPELSDPPIRLHHRRCRRPQRAGHARRRLSRRPCPRRSAQRAEAGGGGPQLPQQPDGRDRQLRFLRPGGRLLPAPRHLHPLRRGLRRDLFRQQSAAVDPADPRRQGPRRRVHLDEQNLLDARLADRLRLRQRQADRGAGAGEVLS